jgi:putative ABC transport system substrate-binding protein
MSGRRDFIVAATCSVLAFPFAAQAQEPGRIYRLSILAPGMRSTSDVGLAKVLAANLRDLGYVEGRNLIVDALFGEDRTDWLPALARELAQRKPDVLVVIGTLATEAGKRATTTIPIVFLTNVDPVAAGFVPSLAQPGGNLTGILIAPEGTLAAKKLELLMDIVPKARRIALLVPDDPGVGIRLQREEIRKAAAALDVELVVVVVRHGDYDGAFAAIDAARPAALFVGAHSLFLRDRRQIIALAARYRLPAIYEWPQHVKDGGLMSYGASDTETYRRVAVYVDRIFKGARPSELPIEQPSKLFLVINLATAKALGITIPQAMRLRADEVIQ